MIVPARGRPPLHRGRTLHFPMVALVLPDDHMTEEEPVADPIGALICSPPGTRIMSRV